MARYGTHVPTSSLEKMLIAAFSAVKALENPHRADMVAALGETTGRVALEGLRVRMKADPVGRQILSDRPLITSSSMDPNHLAQLPPSTLGGAYAQFMREHGFNADERAEVRFVDDEELAYVMLRYRQVHDFWHVLCGLPPTVVGEVALKWLEMIQTQLPMCALSALVAPITLALDDRRAIRQHYIPWAISAGTHSKLLLNVRCFRGPYFKAQVPLCLLSESFLHPYT